MTQQERREYLIRHLLDEDGQYEAIAIPEAESEQKRLLRALMNVRPPRPLGSTFLDVQNEYLTQAARERGIVSIDEAENCGGGLYLWQGDITRLKADAIVNAANSGMTGCYHPNHGCIDNCIHTYAGIQLRLACDELMQKQGHEEAAGQAKITPAYNLPCGYVLHTVGPIVQDRVTPADEELLSSCYRSCLSLAKENGFASIAFCCISTGVFRFPGRRAAEIAVKTVRNCKKELHSEIKVIFNVFKDADYAIYKELLH